MKPRLILFLFILVKFWIKLVNILWGSLLEAQVFIFYFLFIKLNQNHFVTKTSLTIPPPFPELKNALNLGSLPPLSRDSIDRNRTGPIAFAHDKFEIRTVGSSQVKRGRRGEGGGKDEKKSTIFFFFFF